MRPLGKSNVMVGPLGLGTVPLAGFGADVPYGTFEQVVLAAYGAGVRHFDTAPMYGLGKAEHRLGHALHELGIRDQVVVSTKVARVLKPASRTPALETVYGIAWQNPFPFQDTYDYTHDGVMRSFEDSQQRLALDFIDVLLVHDVDRAWHGDEAGIYRDQLRNGGYRALDDLKSWGAIGAVGLGVNETESVVEVADEYPIDCALIAGRYTLLNHAPLAGDFDRLREKGVSVIAGGVYNSGILAQGSAAAGATYDYGRVGNDVLDRVRAIEAVCARHGVSLPAAACQFVAAHPAVTTLCLGAKSVDEVLGNSRAVQEAIPAGFWQDLKASRAIPADAPVPL